MKTDFDTSASFALEVSMPTPSGGKLQIWKRESHDLVNTRDLGATRATMRSIISECLHTGLPCSEPQALAAAYSVPDGAPIDMAVLNVGPLPSDEVIERHMSFQARERGLRFGSHGPIKSTKEIFVQLCLGDPGTCEIVMKR